MTDQMVRRFLHAVKDRKPTSSLQGILGLISKEDFMRWADSLGFDAMHFAILVDNAEAVDFLLKSGYFARPYQPTVSLYTHLAAQLGHRTVLSVLIQHRPDDFRKSELPLALPDRNSFNDERILPGFVGGAVPPKLGKTAPSVVSSNDLGLSDRGLDGSQKDSAKSSPPLRPRDHISFTVDNHQGSKTKKRVNLSDDHPTFEDAHDKTPQTARDKTLQTARDKTLQPLKKTPADVAALAGHVDCVKLLLDMCVLKANPDAPSKGYLTLSALLDSPCAMSLMAKDRPTKADKKQEKLREEDVKAAVDICLQRALPECLDVLLASDSAHISLVFKNINLFHILYTSSAAYGRCTYSRLPEVTRVLIKWNHDVKAKIPPRTYPLYSLISHAFCIHDYSNTSHYLSCVRLLLQGGADPNFDEVAFEKQILQQKGVKFAVGRNAYSSSLHCLLETVEMYATYLESRPLAVRFVEDCAELLTQFSADVTKVGRIGDARCDVQGNVLHQYAKCCVSLGVDKTIMRCMLRHGAEPDVKVKGKYALNVYFDRLFESLKTCEAIDTNHKFLPDVNSMVEFMCDYMTPGHIQDAAVTFSQSHGRSLSPQVQYYVGLVRQQLDRRARCVRSLRHLAAWRIWHLCDKTASRVRGLPVSAELKTLILPLL